MCRSPAVPSHQLLRERTQREKHRARIGTSAHIRKTRAQTRDDFGFLQPEEDIDALLVGEARHEPARRVLLTRARQQLGRRRVAGLAIESEFEIAREVLVPGIDAGRIRQLRQLLGKAFVEELGLAAVVAVADPGIEERVAGEKRGVRRSARARRCA